jgi:hypothetical protein
MADSMYLIVKDIKGAKKIFKDILGDSDIALELVGEKESQHITVGDFGRLSDGKIVVEIPRTLKNLQDLIKNSLYANQLKTKAEFQEFTQDVINAVG